MPRIYEGAIFDIWFCKKTQKRLEALGGDVIARKLLKAQMDWERLADHGKDSLSSENFPSEDYLPSHEGKNNERFYCFKRIPLRAYCWFSQKHEGRVYISHFIHKKKQKLDARDTEKVRKNWRRIEEDGDED